MTLGHELVHLLDMAEHGVSFYATYLSTPVPVGRTWRAHWERRGYAVDLLIAQEMGGVQAVERLHHRLADLFASADYGWMWAGRSAALRYLQPTVDAVCDGRLAREEPYRSILDAWRGSEPLTPESP